MSVLVLLGINLGLLWLLMAAPLGRRTVTVRRRMKAEPQRLRHALDPRNDADWNPAIAASSTVPDCPLLIRRSFNHPDRKGRPITRTVEIAESVETATRNPAYDLRIVDDSALDAGFWADFHEHRALSPSSGGAEMVITQTDHYRGLAFLAFRYFSLRREIGTLQDYLETGRAGRPGFFESPATQAALALLSTLMLWPFFGLTVNGLVLSTLLTIVIVLHELGHMVAYRAFGHERVRMIFVPLLGGIAIGGRPYNSHFEVATCALMGAGLSAFFVPIVMLLQDLGASGVLPVVVGEVSVVALLIIGAFNLLNLLPMDRFDGGQVLRQVFPGRMRAVGSFCITLVILWIGWRIGLPANALIAALAVFTLMSLMSAGFGGRAKPREALDDMKPAERLMAGFGLYAAVAIHGFAIVKACDVLFR